VSKAASSRCQRRLASSAIEFERAWNKVVAGVVAVCPLEKGVEAKEVGAVQRMW
jgi:hypothetical protein